MKLLTFKSIIGADAYQQYKFDRKLYMHSRITIATKQLEKRESKTQKRIKSVKRNSCKF